jgi:hypothetical protein
MHKADHTEVIQKFKPIIYIQGEGTSFHEGGLCIFYFSSEMGANLAAGTHLFIDANEKEVKKSKNFK